MELAFYPVITIESQDELDNITSYCNEFNVEMQFLDGNTDSFPVNLLLYINKQEFEYFLESIE